MNVLKKLGLISFIMLLIIGVMFCFLIRKISYQNLDITEVNDVLMTASENWNGELNQKLNEKAEQYDFEFFVFDSQKNYLFGSKQENQVSFDELVKQRGTTLLIQNQNEILGTLVMNNQTIAVLSQYKNQIIFVFCLALFLMILLIFWLFIYLHRTIMKPFQKLTLFATRIAGGNLDYPLEMDQNNIFGAFTESFDIMRDELKKSQDNEKRANESKKELIASLSHDIKTPLASIKATAELMSVLEQDESKKKKEIIIWNKTNQIEELIDNLFHSTLEELEELKVNVTEESSNTLEMMIKNSDYQNRRNVISIPECLILCDRMRLQQVFDNIINNSYKYANTAFEVFTELDHGYLKISIRDFGQGVSEMEIPKLVRKFYRGENSKNMSGAGIGLYITKYFMEQMQGKAEIKNANPGFQVDLFVKLV